MRFITVTGFFSMLILSGCYSDGQFAEKMKKAMREDPTILPEAIKENPVEFMESLQQAAQASRAEMAKKREADQVKQLDEAFEKPLQPLIRPDEAIRGTKGAPLVLVEYSDFECPFCERGYKTVQDLLKKYDGKMQFIYKHLPLAFHKNAMSASKYYEAIRLRSEARAFRFHDEIYKDQKKLKNGEPFLKSIAKKVGVNMSRLAKDLKDPKVEERIKQDQQEAAKFGMSGTPGFLLNGIPIRGAYPTSHFEQIIDRLKSSGKVTL